MTALSDLLICGLILYRATFDVLLPSLAHSLGGYWLPMFRRSVSARKVARPPETSRYQLRAVFTANSGGKSASRCVEQEA
jgi:hypothetical protein